MSVYKPTLPPCALYVFHLGHRSELRLIGSHRLLYRSETYTYMLALFTHDRVCQLPYKDAVNEVHLHAFLSVR